MIYAMELGHTLSLEALGAILVDILVRLKSVILVPNRKVVWPGRYKRLVQGPRASRGFGIFRKRGIDIPDST